MAAHMSSDEFRKQGYAAIDWIANYLDRVESLTVRSTVVPGGVRRALPPPPPEHGEPFEGVLADLDRVILPGITHWQHPSFFAYFPANASGPAILGDLLASGLGQQGILRAPRLGRSARPVPLGRRRRRRDPAQRQRRRPGRAPRRPAPGVGRTPRARG